MIVVSDTTAISNLFITDNLWILEKLYQKILIPQAVYEELKKLQDYGRDMTKIEHSTWIEVSAVGDNDLLLFFSDLLDKGEAEAIVLAREKNASLLIIDEKKGREYAKKLQLNVIGLLGVLIYAKQQKVIKSVEKIIIDLQNEAGFWVSDQVKNKALILANEK